jgi:hypothetical protein
LVPTCISKQSAIWQNGVAHRSCISDDHVEGFTLCEECIGAVSYADKIGKIERNQLEAGNMERSVLQHLCRRRFNLSHIPGRAHNLSAVRSK